MLSYSKFDKVCLLFILFLFINTASYSQSLSEWSFEFTNDNIYTTQQHLPLWLHSNRYGLYDPGSSAINLGINAQKEVSDTPVVDYGLGIETIGRLSKNTDAFFNQLYLELKLDFLNFYAGKKKWRDGLFTSDLSLGSMVWSSNAPTMPKLMIYTPHFVSVPFTNDFLAFKTYIGHGWFEGDRFVENAYLHEKAFYVRFLPSDFIANGYVGAIHNVQWGGTHPTIGRLPQGIDDFVRVVTGKAGGGGSVGGEVVNALGNTVGAYEAMLELTWKDINVKAYRQFYIETSVSTRLRSPWDGMWGLELNFRQSDWIDQFLWEHVNTKKQNAKQGEEIGADGYYDNFLYQDGWTYKGRIIGLPLVTLGEVNGRTGITHNIILAHHFGLEGKIPVSFSEFPLHYKVMTSYSRNYGKTTPCSNDFCDEDDDYPLRTSRTDQFYNMLQLGYPLSDRIQLTKAIGTDVGELANNFGLFLGFSYSL